VTAARAAGSVTSADPNIASPATPKVERRVSSRVDSYLTDRRME
jgi:hypothetical protein